jgi:cytochrome c oxidase assembly protein subunit 15
VNALPQYSEGGVVSMVIKMTSQYNKSLRNFTFFLAISTFLLIVAGGLVTSTDSGLSVPDWPLSYGMIMPPMVGGIFYEHGHRMIASFVGLLTVVLVFLAFRLEKRTWLRRLSLVALAAVILQGLLGGMTVLYLLPTWISVSHATLAQTFFSLVCSIALFQSSWWQSTDTTVIGAQKGRGLLVLGIAAIAAVYLQLVFGALMRHTASGLAVPDFPLAYGQIIPSLSSDAMSRYNAELIVKNIRIAADGPITSAQVTIHMIHRFWAIVAGTIVLAFAYRVKQESPSAKILRFPSLALMILVPLQICLGAFTVLSRKAVDITTVHVATGALILMTCIVSILMVYRISPHARRSSELAMNLKGVTA